MQLRISLSSNTLQGGTEKHPTKDFQKSRGCVVIKELEIVWRSLHFLVSLTQKLSPPKILSNQD